MITRPSANSHHSLFHQQTLKHHREFCKSPHEPWQIFFPPNAETMWEINRNAGSLRDPPREDIQPSNKSMLFFRPRQGVPSLCYVRSTTGKQKTCVAHYVEFPSSKITIFMLISSSNCVAWSFTAAMKYFVTVAQAYTSFTVTCYCSRATAPQRKTKASSWRAHDLWRGG